MSVFSALFDNKVYSFEQAFGVKDLTTNPMKAAIRDWYGLYYGDTPPKEEDPSQRIPVAIVSKLTKTAFSEYKAGTALPGPKGKYVASVLSALDRVRGAAMQNAFVGGECFLKPVFAPNGLVFAVVARGNYLVLGRDERGEITDIGTAEKTAAGKRYYTLLERRRVDYAGYLTIESRLYESDTAGEIGTEVPLTALDKYAALTPVNTLPLPVGSLGFIHLRTPLENCVDGSGDSVSVYAPAAGLIHLINRNEAQINREFSNAESRIIVSSDLLERDEKGRKKVRDDIFTALDEDPGDIGINIFSPAIREQSFLARKAEYLRNCETLIGLKRGILSEVEAAERTATEITSSAGDYNLTITDLQRMWETALREAVRVCDILGQMYKACDSATVDVEKDISVSWGNGILYDEDKTWAEYTALVASGMLKPEIALAWYFDLPWETPEDLAAIRERYMPEMEALTGGDG